VTKFSTRRADRVW